MVSALGESTGISFMTSEVVIQHCNPGQHFNTRVLYCKGSFDMQTIFLLYFMLQNKLLLIF